MSQIPYFYIINITNISVQIQNYEHLNLKKIFGPHTGIIVQHGWVTFLHGDSYSNDCVPVMTLSNLLCRPRVSQRGLD